MSTTQSRPRRPGHRPAPLPGAHPRRRHRGLAPHRPLHPGRFFDAMDTLATESVRSRGLLGRGDPLAGLDDPFAELLDLDTTA
ncbi:hypothetical protein GCM10010182_01930 [Actinomadura cremea]|nr:hypothetical protein GCM10010182_01930 [Actinomadura cremea]